MKTSSLLFILAAVFLAVSCKQSGNHQNRGSIAASGQMPDLAVGDNGNCYLVYGSSDSLLYAISNDGGIHFSSPFLISVIPQLVAAHMRGPRIAVTTNGIAVIACNKQGNIFSFTKDGSDKWSQPVRVNDADTVAKEAFMALGADGDNMFAAWLDLRGNKRNKIVGARSTDGGKTWSKNILVYASPDTTVCPCCKPSVAVSKGNVYVMFRNWLGGNRDLYLARSTDGGGAFDLVTKLGNGSWPLNGCPMDGGGLSISSNGEPQTVWRRKDTIYSCQPGQPEQALGEGRSCGLASVNGKNVYAWTENGEVVILKPRGEKISLGKGQLPVVKRINNDGVLCVWENDDKIYTAVLGI